MVGLVEAIILNNFNNGFGQIFRHILPFLHHRTNFRRGNIYRFVVYKLNMFFNTIIDIAGIKAGTPSHNQVAVIENFPVAIPFAKMNQAVLTDTQRIPVTRVITGYIFQCLNSICWSRKDIFNGRNAD